MATSSFCRADQSTLPGFLREFGLLPLAERPLLLGSVRRGLIPVLILVAAMGATAFGVLPVPIAFFAAAVMMVLFKVIPLREVYGSLDGPILVMLAALIPVSDSLRRTGATDVIASGLAELRRVAARLWIAGADPGRGDGRYAFPQQCGDGSGHGAHRGRLRGERWDIAPRPS